MTRWGRSPRTTARSMGPSCSTESNGVASVTPVTPWPARSCPTRCRSGAARGMWSESHRSSRSSRPVGMPSSPTSQPGGTGPSSSPTAASAREFSTQSAPERCCTRTGRSSIAASSCRRSRGESARSWYPTARSHAPGAFEVAAPRSTARSVRSSTTGGPTSTDSRAAASAIRCRWWSWSPGRSAPPPPSTTSMPEPVASRWPMAWIRPSTTATSRSCPSCSTWRRRRDRSLIRAPGRAGRRCDGCRRPTGALVRPVSAGAAAPRPGARRGATVPVDRLAGDVGGDPGHRHVDEPATSGLQGGDHGRGRGHPSQRVGHRVDREARARLVERDQPAGDGGVVAERDPVGVAPEPGDGEPRPAPSGGQDLFGLDPHGAQRPRS